MGYCLFSGCCLAISHFENHPKGPENIPIELCVDILPKGNHTTTVPFIRFHLCDEDLALLHSTPLLRAFLRVQARKKVKDFVASRLEVKRRKHALFGQGVLGGFASIQYRGLLVVVNPSCFSLPGDWQAFGALEAFINDKADLPDDFPDWGEEGHEGDDEEYDTYMAEEYFGLD